MALSGRWAFVILTISSGSLALTDFFRDPPIPGPAGDYSDNNLYQIGTTAHISWRTTYTNITLRLHQQPYPNGTDYETVLNNTANSNGLDWTVATSQNISAQPVFYFEVMDESRGDKGASFNSHYFNLTNSRVNPTETASSSPSTTASNSILESASATSDPTGSRQSQSSSDTSRATPTSSSSSNPDHRYAVGMGVGIGLGIPLAIGVGAAGMYFFLRRRMRPARRSSSYRYAPPVELPPESDAEYYEMEGGASKAAGR